MACTLGRHCSQCPMLTTGPFKKTGIVFITQALLLLMDFQFKFGHLRLFVHDRTFIQTRECFCFTPVTPQLVDNLCDRPRPTVCVGNPLAWPVLQFLPGVHQWPTQLPTPAESWCRNPLRCRDTYQNQPSTGTKITSLNQKCDLLYAQQLVLTSTLSVVDCKHCRMISLLDTQLITRILGMMTSHATLANLFPSEQRK